MKEIKLCGTGEYIAFVDDEHFEMLSQYRWYALRVRRSKTIYARASVNGKTIYMHRLVMGEPNGLVVDHIDFNGLNNQSANLQAVTQQQNIMQGLIRQDIAAWRASRDARRAKEMETFCKPPKWGVS